MDADFLFAKHSGEADAATKQDQNNDLTISRSFKNKIPFLKENHTACLHPNATDYLTT